MTTLAWSCVLAEQLFLTPATVLALAHYWVSQYADYTLPQEEAFGALVSAFWERAPALEVAASEGLAHRGADVLTYPLQLQFAGSPLHRVPGEYLARRQRVSLLRALSWLVRPAHEAFASRVADGLDAELALSGFGRDDVLAAFYEPAFFVLSAYAVHLCALCQLRDAEGFAEEALVRRHLGSLHALDAPRVTCFGGGRAERLVKELLALRAALDTADLDVARATAQARWAEKAAWCEAQIDARWAAAYRG